MHVQMFRAEAVSVLVNWHKQPCCSLVNQQVNKTQALWTLAKQNGICMLTNSYNPGETRKRCRRQTQQAIVHGTILWRAAPKETRGHQQGTNRKGRALNGDDHEEPFKGCWLLLCNGEEGLELDGDSQIVDIPNVTIASPMVCMFFLFFKKIITQSRKRQDRDLSLLGKCCRYYKLWKGQFLEISWIPGRPGLLPAMVACHSCPWFKTLDALQSPPVHEGWAP